MSTWQFLKPPKVDLQVNIQNLNVTDTPGLAFTIRTALIHVIGKILSPPNAFEVQCKF